MQIGQSARDDDDPSQQMPLRNTTFHVSGAGIDVRDNSLGVRDGNIRSHVAADLSLPDEWSETCSDGGVQLISCRCG
jgi:hypothetical protein